MIFEALQLSGAYLIKPEKHEDDRGSFARCFCKKEFQTHQLISEFVQCNISHNRKKGTLRGMHYQTAPHEEVKLVRCISGAIYDVIIDLRANSPSLNQWYAVELNPDNQFALYIPEGFAHGFLTLADDTAVYYQMSEYYHPESATGLRWDDPRFNIPWPECEHVLLSDKDRAY